jgi:hypothetical protein
MGFLPIFAMPVKEFGSLGRNPPRPITTFSLTFERGQSIALTVTLQRTY